MNAWILGRGVTSLGDDSIEILLADLRAEYLSGFAARVAEIRAALARAATEPAAREGLQRLAHRIGGTSGTVGLLDLGLAGRAIEAYCARCGWSAASCARIAAAIDDLEAMAARAGAAPAGELYEPADLADYPAVVALQEGVLR